MTVDEGRMAWGSFTLSLREDTPQSVVHKLWNSAFGLIRIFDQRVDASQVGVSARGLFTGVLQTMNDRTLGGPGQTWWLGRSSDMWAGDWDELGPYSVSTPVSFDGTTNGTLTQWVNETLDVCSTGISSGTIGGPSSSTKAAGSLRRRTAKTIFDNFIVPVFGVEYRVTPELEVDVGYVSELYPVAQPAPLVVRKGGRDPNFLGFDTDVLHPEMSVEGFLTRGTAWHREADYPYNVYNSHSYKKPDGNDLNWGHHQAISTESDEAWLQALDTQAAAAGIAAESEDVQSVTLSAKEYGITRRLKAGDYVYVYDVSRGLFEHGNPVNFRGQTIYPVLLRVETITWPVEHGMYVFLDNRHQGGALDVTDLTNYIEFEETGQSTKMTVGRPRKSLGASLR